MKVPKPEFEDIKRASVKTGRTVMAALGWAFRIIGTLVLIFITTGSIMVVIFSIFLTRYLNVEMDVNLEGFQLNQTSTVYYTDPETGHDIEMGTLHGNENRKMVEFDEIPQNMIDALVAIEDKRFFQHNGVDWKRTANAVLEMFTGSGSSGGSTITQQLIKNLTNEKDVTIQRKVQEIFKAIEFEKSYSKQKILEWYMNTSYFGHGCYGVKTAAEVYFGKELHELTAAESACIIGITQYPSLYDPYINPDKNKERQETILSQMLVQGKLTESEYKRAVDQPLVLVRSKATDQDAEIQPLFMDQVFYDVVDALGERMNLPKAMAQSLLYSAGFNIYTTMDTRVQGVIDEIYSDDENFPVVKNSEKPQSAIMVMDPYTGNVLGFGQRGKKTANLVRVLPTMAQRQPGSSIKPVTVYAAAMDMGFITPYSVVDDAPLKNLNRAWPRNSSGGYKGRTNVITAVQNSVNTIAVRVVDAMTPQRSFDFGYYTMNMRSLVEERWVKTSNGEIKQTDIDLGPMALGGLTKGLTVRELTAAYCAFPNKGVYVKPRTFTVIKDSTNTDVILDNNSNASVVMKEKTAYYMNTVLQQVIKAGTGARANFDNMHIAGKTGTTTEDKDRWFVGYTPYYVAGSWYGFDIPKKITLAQSTNPALAMWKLVMERLHENLEDKEFFEPEGLVSMSYCLDSGMAPTDACRSDPRGSRVASGTVAKDDVIKTPCDVHVFIDVDSTTNHLATPYCPAENIKKVGLLDLNRGMPLAGVVLGDEQYTVRYFGSDGGVVVPPVPEGTFRAVAGSGDSGVPYNSFCPNHLTAVTTPTSIDQFPVDPSLGYPTLPNDFPINDEIPTAPPTPDVIED